MALHFHKLTVKDIKKETSDCISIAFDIPRELQKEFQFSAGQNITIKTDLDDTRRSYSICSSPGDGELRVAVKKVANGVFSSFANEKLKKGEALEWRSPTVTGTSAINSKNKKEYVFFAAGSGITPVISIIKTILNGEPASHVTLVYGPKKVSNLLYQAAQEALKDKYLESFRMYHILSR